MHGSLSLLGNCQVSCLEAPGGMQRRKAIPLQGNCLVRSELSLSHTTQGSQVAHEEGSPCSTQGTHAPSKEHKRLVD